MRDINIYFNSYLETLVKINYFTNEFNGQNRAINCIMKVMKYINIRSKQNEVEKKTIV